VRVFDLDFRSILQPLTSILSPCSKGRGEEMNTLNPELVSAVYE